MWDFSTFFLCAHNAPCIWNVILRHLCQHFFSWSCMLCRTIRSQFNWTFHWMHTRAETLWSFWLGFLQLVIIVIEFVVFTFIQTTENTCNDKIILISTLQSPSWKLMPFLSNQSMPSCWSTCLMSWSARFHRQATGEKAYAHLPWLKIIEFFALISLYCLIENRRTRRKKIAHV